MPPYGSAPQEGTEAKTLEAAVPVLERHPDFELNRRFDDTCNTTERAMNLHRRTESYAVLRTGDGVRAADMDRFGARDPCLRQSELGQRRARLIEIA